MGQRIEVVLTCDLHEGEVPADETVTFAVDGTTYAFELCAEHLSEFRDTLGRYVGAARRADQPRRGRRRSESSAPSRSSSSGKTDLAEVRSWARSQGYKVSDRGRISAEVQEAYEAATGS
jgi:Lsr2